MQIIFQKTDFLIDPSKPEGFFAGYASKFGGVDSYRHTIDRHAYDKIITGPMPKLFFNHMTWSDVPVGILTHWHIDDVGLYVEGELNLKIQKARDIYESMKTGAIDGLSVSIEMNYDNDDMEFDENDILHIKNVQKMREISICTFPADDEARIINVKSLDGDKITTVRDLERQLRDAGFSKNEACVLISTVKKTIKNDDKHRDDGMIRRLNSFNSLFQK